MPDTQVAHLICSAEGRPGRQRGSQARPGFFCSGQSVSQNSASSPRGAELLTLKDPFHGLVYPPFSDKRNKSPETQELDQGH